ncbi:hypothetical protein AAW51_4093 [Caldimonas brevitalea]|uniref:Integrase catalytic domain-containing protein n=1 Tax=Caldimonas brevitalea TaxID=413882 RepID=A0A0G3BMX6_9BURK|nr:hypothetical protein AAW51_4093 [Caldimonas brevitalea]
MSRKGNGWDNAAIERFFLNLKIERVQRHDGADQADATVDIADDIVGFYNSRACTPRSPSHKGAWHAGAGLACSWCPRNHRPWNSEPSWTVVAESEERSSFLASTMVNRSGAAVEAGMYRRAGC